MCLWDRWHRRGQGQWHPPDDEDALDHVDEPEWATADALRRCHAWPATADAFAVTTARETRQAARTRVAQRRRSFALDFAALLSHRTRQRQCPARPTPHDGEVAGSGATR
jgi:hypothetical protein